MTDIPGSVTEAARLLRAGDLTSTELTRAVLARADALDPLLGVYLDRYDGPALEAAATADRELRAGIDRGELHGIPIGLKDILAAVEGPTTAQSMVHDRTWWAGRDAPVVTRLRAAGAVIMGKVTMMEYAVGAPDPSKPFPIPRNPWDPARWPGGSSSGTGVGVAAGFFLAGLGTDTGGSIRIPSALCGISGLMPTFGRVPKNGCVPLGYSHDHIGPMARTVRDCASMLQAMSGYDPGDPDCADARVPDFSARAGPRLDGLRLGVERVNHSPQGADPAAGRCFDAALDVFEGLGATLADVVLPRYHETVAAGMLTTMAEAFSYHRPTLGSRWGDYCPSTRVFVAQGSTISAADLVHAQRVRRLVRAELAEIFSSVDAVLMPGNSVGAPRYEHMDRIFEFLPYFHTPYWDPVGNPALVLPMGFTAEGLPLSLQVAAAPWDEQALVAVGDAFQRVTDYHTRTPGVVVPLEDASSPLDLPSPPAKLTMPAPPGVGDIATVALLLERSGVRVPEEGIEEVAAMAPMVSEMLAALRSTDVGEEVPALRFEASVARSPRSPAS